jgi:hypothetical protein
MGDIADTVDDGVAPDTKVAVILLTVSWSRSGRPRIRENRVRSLAEVGFSWRR